MARIAHTAIHRKVKPSVRAPRFQERGVVSRDVAERAPELAAHGVDVVPLGFTRRRGHVVHGHLGLVEQPLEHKRGRCKEHAPASDGLAPDCWVMKGNLANQKEISGFKRARTKFTCLLYVNERMNLSERYFSYAAFSVSFL